MGSLVLAGAAEGLGKGIVANVDDRQASREKDLDRQHDLALQRMRDASASGRLESTQDFAREQTETTRGFQVEDRDEERSYQESLLEGTQGREDTVREDEQEHDVFIEAMRQYTSGTASRTTKTDDGKWEMKVLTKGEIGPDGIPVETDTFVVRQPGTPFSFVQEGLNMLPYNYTDEQKTRALAIATSGNANLAKAKKDLISKAGTEKDDSDAFMDAYGFLPSEYFRKLGTQARAGGAGSFENFYMNFRQRNGGGGASTPGTSNESKTIRASLNTSTDPSAAFGAKSEAALAQMDDQEYVDQYSAAFEKRHGRPATDEDLNELIRLNMLPSQRREKSGQSGGMLSQAANVENENAPTGGAFGTEMSQEDVDLIANWIGSQMQTQQ